MYDPATNTWQTRANLPEPRSHFEPGTVDFYGRVRIVGGRSRPTGQETLDSMREYDPARNVWYGAGTFPARRIAPGAAFVNDKLLVFGGGGPNSTLLHYMKDRAAVKPGDVVVMDAATEYQGYAADVTRTIPVSGKYTAEQRALYELVLAAQKAAERTSKPGMSSVAAQDSSWDVRAKGLVRLGLVESVDAELDLPWPANCTANPRTCKQAMFWMIHGISHGIGLAVHDPAQFYTGDRTFKQGDAFTIEPGIYVSQAMLDALPDTPKNRAFKAKVKDVVPRYQNTGVRIEDSYIITDKGLERISSGAPREIDEVEALMKKRSARAVP
jgi:Xaa-Pro aminopeptidase